MVTILDSTSMCKLEICVPGHNRGSLYKQLGLAGRPKAEKKRKIEKIEEILRNLKFLYSMEKFRGFLSLDLFISKRYILALYLREC